MYHDPADRVFLMTAALLTAATWLWWHKEGHTISGWLKADMQRDRR